MKIHPADVLCISDGEKIFSFPEITHKNQPLVDVEVAFRRCKRVGFFRKLK